MRTTPSGAFLAQADVLTPSEETHPRPCEEVGGYAYGVIRNRRDVIEQSMTLTSSTTNSDEW